MQFFGRTYPACPIFAEKGPLLAPVGWLSGQFNLGAGEVSLQMLRMLGLLAKLGQFFVCHFFNLGWPATVIQSVGRAFDGYCSSCSSSSGKNRLVSLIDRFEGLWSAGCLFSGGFKVSELLFIGTESRGGLGCQQLVSYAL